MSFKSLILVALAVGLLTTGADAGPKGNSGNDQKADKGCPPGLAKKGNGCRPPGLAKKGLVSPPFAAPVLLDGQHYLAGDALPDDYVILLDPLVHLLPQTAITVRYGDFLYLIDRDTGLVLEQLGHRADWDWRWDDVDFAGCPPGLAKKNPPCIPPGLAKQGRGDDLFRAGDRLPVDYILLFDPHLTPADPRWLYVRQGDTIYRIDRETGLVIDLIGSVADLLR